jgi:hypothetical protein
MKNTGPQEMGSVPKEFTASLPMFVPTKKIPQMVVKCIHILDPTVEVKFVEYLDLCCLACADIEQKKIILPSDEHDLEQLLVFAFHELAHVWYTTPFSKLACELNEKEDYALRLLEEIRVDLLFCKRNPEFRWVLWKFNKMRNKSEFIAGLLYALWSPLEGVNETPPACEKLKENGLLEELSRATIAAESTEDLIPFARRLAREL